MDTNYYNQYLKYKNKYLQLKKNQKGGSSVGPFQVGETYYLKNVKNEGEIINSDKKIANIQKVAEYNIDSFGFSQKEPNYFFQIQKIEDHPYPYADIYTLKIYDFTPDLKLPDHMDYMIDKNFTLPRNELLKYKIDTNTGIVTDKRFANFFKGYYTSPVYSNEGFYTVKLNKNI